MEGGVSALGRGYLSKALRDGGVARGDDGGEVRSRHRDRLGRGSLPGGFPGGGQAASRTSASGVRVTEGLRAHSVLAWGHHGGVLSKTVPRSGWRFKRSIT